MIDNFLPAFIQNNIELLKQPVMLIAGAVIARLFLKGDTSLATSVQEFEKIKAGHMKEVATKLLETGKMTYSEYYKMSNFLEIAQKADKELSKKVAVEPFPQQDIDWFMRFYDDCGNISNDDLQTIWAKILANEIHVPGSYSFRTLDTLKNISSTEAKLFADICNACVKTKDYVFLLSDEGFLKNYNISYDDILKLTDCGLINGNTSLCYHPIVSKAYTILCKNKNWNVLAKLRPNVVGNTVQLTIGAYILTNSGAELYSVINHDKPIDLHDLCQFLKQDPSLWELRVVAKGTNAQ